MASLAMGADVKATVVKRSSGLALHVSATDPAEMLLLEMFLEQVAGQNRQPLWASQSGSRHGNSGEVVERNFQIEAAGPDVAFSSAIRHIADRRKR